MSLLDRGRTSMNRAVDMTSIDIAGLTLPHLVLIGVGRHLARRVFWPTPTNPYAR